MKNYIYFLITSSSVLLRMGNVSDKVVEKIKTNVLCSITYFPLENCAVYKIMWKNMEWTDRPQMSIWCMRFAFWIPKTTHTHTHKHTHTNTHTQTHTQTNSEYVILIAFHCTNIALKSLNGKLYVHCVSCWIQFLQCCYVVEEEHHMYTFLPYYES